MEGIVVETKYPIFELHKSFLFVFFLCPWNSDNYCCLMRARHWLQSSRVQMWPNHKHWGNTWLCVNVALVFSLHFSPVLVCCHGCWFDSHSVQLCAPHYHQYLSSLVCRVSSMSHVWIAEADRVHSFITWVKVQIPLAKFYWNAS